MSNIFSSENREYSSCFLFGNPICKLHLCSSVSNGSSMPEVLEHSWVFSEHYLEKYPIHELIFERTVAFVDLIVFWIAVFVRIVLEYRRWLTKSIVLTSRMLLHHRSIVERLMAPLSSRKIFVVPSPLSYFESTNFCKSLLFIWQNRYKVVQTERFSMVL